MEPCLICTRVTLIFLWLLKRQKLYFAFWYFNALVCFITLAKREIKDSRLQECPKVALPKLLTIVIPVLTVVSSPDVTAAIVARNYRKKIGFLVCKRENFAGLQSHRKRPTSHHARFTAQLLSPRIQVYKNWSGDFAARLACSAGILWVGETLFAFVILL